MARAGMNALADTAWGDLAIGSTAPVQAIAPPAQSELVLEAELVDDDDDILIPESFDAEPEAPPVQAAAPKAAEPKLPGPQGQETFAVDDILEVAEVMSAEPQKAQADAEPAWDVFTDESSLSASVRSDAADAGLSTPSVVAASGHEDGLLDVMEFEDLPDAPAAVEAAESKVTAPGASAVTASHASTEQESVAQLTPGSPPEELRVSAHSDAQAAVEVGAPLLYLQESPVDSVTVAHDVDADALEFSLAGESATAPTPPAPESSESWQVAAAPKTHSDPAVSSPEAALAVAPTSEAAPSADASRTGIPPEFELALIPEGASPQEPQAVLAPEPSATAEPEAVALTPAPVPTQAPEAVALEPTDAEPEALALARITTESTAVAPAHSDVETEALARITAEPEAVALEPTDAEPEAPTFARITAEPEAVALEPTDAETEASALASITTEPESVALTPSAAETEAVTLKPTDVESEAAALSPITHIKAAALNPTVAQPEALALAPTTDTKAVALASTASELETVALAPTTDTDAVALASTASELETVAPAPTTDTAAAALAPTTDTEPAAPVPTQVPETAARDTDAQPPVSHPEDTTPPKPRLVAAPVTPSRARTPIALDDLPASSEEPMQLASTWEFVGWQGGGEGEGTTVGHTAETTWADRGVDLDGPATATPSANEGGVALASAWEFMQQPWQPQATLPLDTAQGLLAAASASTDTPPNGPSVTADQVLTALDTADSQGTVGKVLLAYSAGRFRRAFLLGDSFGLARVGRAWGPGSERPEVSALKVDLDAPSLLASALKGPSPSVFSAPQGPQDEAIFSALCESESHLLVFPLHARGQPVAFFVAEHGPAPVELSTLEELARIADRAVEICTRLHRFP